MNILPPLTRRRSAMLFGDDSGAATAEYAITTMAVVGAKKHTQNPNVRSINFRARSASALDACLVCSMGRKSR